MTGVSGIVLAAGESVRMGQPKALLEWQGRPLLQYQVQALLEVGMDEVVVVLGYRAGKLKPLVSQDPRVRVAASRRYRLGKTYSIRSGLRNINSRAQGVLIAAVDQPRQLDTLRALLQAFASSRPAITAPSYQGKSGHPLIFNSSLFRELTHISEERQGLQAVVERHQGERLLVEVDDPLVTVNMNTPEEYKGAQRLGAPRSNDGPGWLC